MKIKQVTQYLAVLLTLGYSMSVQAQFTDAEGACIGAVRDYVKERVRFMVDRGSGQTYHASGKYDTINKGPGWHFSYETSKGDMRGFPMCENIEKAFFKLKTDEIEAQLKSTALCKDLDQASHAKIMAGFSERYKVADVSKLHIATGTERNPQKKDTNFVDRFAQVVVLNLHTKTSKTQTIEQLIREVGSRPTYHGDLYVLSSYRPNVSTSSLLSRISPENVRCWDPLTRIDSTAMNNPNTYQKITIAAGDGSELTIGVTANQPVFAYIPETGLWGFVKAGKLSTDQIVLLNERTIDMDGKSLATVMANEAVQIEDVNEGNAADETFYNLITKSGYYYISYESDETKLYNSILVQGLPK